MNFFRSKHLITRSKGLKGLQKGLSYYWHAFLFFSVLMMYQTCCL